MFHLGDNMQTQPKTNVDLDKLVEKIDAAHQEARKAEWSSLTHARTAGQLLRKVKGKLDHGDWEPWVAKNCEFSIRQAQRYMFVAAHHDELKALKAKKPDLSLSECVTALVEQRRSRHNGGKAPVPLTLTVAALKGAEAVENKPRLRRDTREHRFVEAHANQFIRSLIRLVGRTASKAEGEAIDPALMIISLREHFVNALDPSRMARIATELAAATGNGGQKPPSRNGSAKGQKQKPATRSS